MAQSNSKIKKSFISFYWIVPLIALLITASLIWQNTFNKGELVYLNISEASGIEIGKTLVKFHSVTVGVVENIALNKEQNGALISIRMNSDVNDLLKEDTKFWVVKPRIQTTAISGLETILSGVYIQMSKGNSSKFSNEFNAVDDISALYSDNIDNFSIILIGNNKRVIKRGVPINYKGFEIGVISDYSFDKDSQKVIYKASIKKDYSNLVNSNSIFWVDKGFDFTFNASEFKFIMPNLDNFLSGSINVDNNPKKSDGNPLKNNDVFSLNENFDDYIKDKDSLEYVIFLDGSIQNLRVGSDVTLRGIKIGKVAAVPWFENEISKYDLKDPIPILLNVFVPKAEKDRLSKYFSSYLAKSKLCASLSSSNLLNQGSLVSLELKNKEKCYAHTNSYRGVKVIPISKKSSLNDELLEFSKKVNDLDIKEISDNLDKSLVSLNSTLKSVDLLFKELKDQKTIEKINHTLDSYNKDSALYNSILDLLDNLNTNLNELSPTIKKLGNKSNSLIFQNTQTDLEPKVK